MNKEVNNKWEIFMHTLKLKIKDRVFDEVEYFLSNLSKDDVEIISDKVIAERNNSDDSIDFSEYDISSFKILKDPLSWQQSIRDEWDR